MSVWPFKQIILRAQLSKAPIPSPKQATLSPAAHASHAGSSTPGQSLTASSSSQAASLTPQQLVQQKQQAQQESASQPGSEMSHEGSQQQQAVPSLAAQPGAEIIQSAQQQQQQQQQQEQQQQPQLKASTDQNSPGLGQHQARAEVGSAKTSTMQTDFLFHFGDTTQIRKALEMPNRLTGYAFLIDSNGLVRWRGSGLAEQSEVDGLLRAADQLLK
ncbi:TPA: hypothetical protein ACH3X2_007342 [Trebouxia sp. C0005]